VSVTDIGSALETMMGSRRVTTFVDNGEEYDVMVQAGREGRAAPADLEASACARAARWCRCPTWSR
jgi:multidrug efflux pump